MAYSIVESSANEFGTRKKIKLPRFQRKQTWKDVDNFKLCISVFKGYPIGVVIVNEVDQTEWLLDGRQRRNAIKTMKENPVAIYNWAKSFIKFKPSDSEEEVRNKFWSKIDIYLQTESEEKNKTENDSEEELEEDNDIELGEEASFDSKKQYASLVLLLNLVLLVHSTKNKITRFERMFLFNKTIPAENLKYTYANDKGEYVCDPVKLKRLLTNTLPSEISYEGTAPSEEEFIDYFKTECRLDDAQAKAFKKYVQQNWSFYYEKCFKIIQECDQVIDDARVGMIKLINASTLDAQNIFSLVNDGGTKLTSEELLSARPFWNKVVNNNSDEVRDEVKKLYGKLKLDIPEDIYRWDLGATIISRIDTNHLIFPDLTIDTETKDLNNTKFKARMSLGFKLLSAIYDGGISINNVIALEQRKDINWDTDINKLVTDFNTIIRIVEDTPFFKHLQSWNKSIMELTTNAAAQEFLVVLYKQWISYDKPTKARTASAQKLQKDAIVLFDKLIYENCCTKSWRGSSDSKLARDLKNTAAILSPIPEAVWNSAIKELANGTYNGDVVSFETIKPLVYYYCALRQFIPRFNASHQRYEIDHIIAQHAITNAGSQIDQKLKDWFINLSPLPKGDNIEKSDKPLNKIDDEFILEQIKILADLSDEDVERFSNVINIEALKEKRLNLYLEAFTKKRNLLLADWT